MRLKKEPALSYVFPIKVSGNKRYFVDQNNQPVFWLGDTQWELFRSFSLADAETILRNRKDKGIAFIQVMLFGVGDGLKPNLNGEFPWQNKNTLTPNEKYFQHVDAVLRLAQKIGVIISLTLFHQCYRGHITVGKARGWARWLAKRYHDMPNIIWSTTPEANDSFAPILREIAAGLKEADGNRHLITFKPDPAPFTSSFLHNEPWLDYNCMQTWKWVALIYPFIHIDYHIMKPVKPVVMAEGAYEAGSEYGFNVSPLWVRRQAYYSYFAGAHHTYGHNDSWRVLPTWKSALDAPGAFQMSILRKIFMERKEWWLLVPDQAVLAENGRISGEVLTMACCHQKGKWAMVYAAAPTTFTVRLDKVKTSAGKKILAKWVNPLNGNARHVEYFRNRGTEQFTTPKGWDDALLVLEI
jgi:hypothetical protein